MTGPAPAGYYTLCRTAPPRLPEWEIETVRLRDPDLVRLWTVGVQQYLNADEAAAARAVPLPAGLALVYTEPPGG